MHGVHTDRISDGVWLTEKVHDDPEDSAPYTVRVVWDVTYLKREKRALITADRRKRMFNGCSNGSDAFHNNVPWEHIDAISREVALHFARENSSHARTQFTQSGMGAKHDAYDEPPA
jgi:hypothetical protein